MGEGQAKAGSGWAGVVVAFDVVISYAPLLVAWLLTSFLTSDVIESHGKCPVHSMKLRRGLRWSVLLSRATIVRGFVSRRCRVGELGLYPMPGLVGE